jgi:mercuric ion transport protein
MRETILAAGGAVSAVAASSCCIVPLALVSVGVSGAWIGNLTALAPYQPLFLAIAVASLGAGFWLVYRRSPADCKTHTCATATRLIKSVFWVKGILWLGAALVALSLGADYSASLFL